MSEAKTIKLAQNAKGTMEGKYLTFTLAEEEFGIGILTVKEIIGMMTITPLPRTPDWVLGVINLRGMVIPVIDLRLKFSMASRPFDERTCIVVVEVGAGQGLISIGLVVDHVNEVANIREDEVEATPNFGASLDTDYILGMAKTGAQVRILLNMDRVLGGEELSMLGQAA